MVWGIDRSTALQLLKAHRPALVERFGVIRLWIWKTWRSSAVAFPECGGVNLLAMSGRG